MSETLTRIDISKPAGPIAYTADVRANFQAAQDQIDALQAQGGVPGPPGPPGADSTVPGPAGPPGPSTVSADANNVASIGTDGFIYVPQTGGGGGDYLPLDGSGTMETGITYAPAAANGWSRAISFGWTGSAFAAYVDDTFVDTLAVLASLSLYLGKTGGTMTGPLVLAADPTTALQAATKQYVDAAVAPLRAALQAAGLIPPGVDPL
jgi:hypothetical protein